MAIMAEGIHNRYLASPCASQSMSRSIDAGAVGRGSARAGASPLASPRRMNQTETLRFPLAAAIVTADKQIGPSVRKHSAHCPLWFVCLVTGGDVGNSFVCGIESLNDERVAAAGHYSE